MEWIARLIASIFGTAQSEDAEVEDDRKWRARHHDNRIRYDLEQERKEKQV